MRNDVDQGWFTDSNVEDVDSLSSAPEGMVLHTLLSVIPVMVSWWRHRLAASLNGRPG
jgi:hypothetical protein